MDEFEMKLDLDTVAAICDALVIAAKDQSYHLKDWDFSRTLATFSERVVGSLIEDSYPE